MQRHLTFIMVLIIMVLSQVRAQTVTTLTGTIQSAGMQSIQWDARNKNGETAASGVYVYRLSIGYSELNKEMVLLR